MILKQFDAGASRRRVGLRAEGRAPVARERRALRQRNLIDKIGIVTSGGLRPDAQRTAAMGYLPTALSKDGTIVFADVRGQRLPLRVAPMPFVPNGYKR